MIICPKCSNNKLDEQNVNIKCLNCNEVYYKNKKFIDFIIYRKSNKLEELTKKLWGEDLFKNLFCTPVHYTQIKNTFKDNWNNSFKGKLIEIGCGSGSDTKYFSNYNQITHLTSIDIGNNTYNLYKYFEQKNNVSIYRASALCLPFTNNCFDTVYSYGVFHHTNNPKKCLKESYRVLKKNGTMYVYLYSMHENNLLKYFGIKVEACMRFLMRKLSYKIQNMICFLLSPIMWTIFSLPAVIIYKLGFKDFSKKIPMNWGSHPFSLINDLKDRLIAPINYRFSKKELYNHLTELGFKNLIINEKSSGFFVFCNK